MRNKTNNIETRDTISKLLQRFDGVENNNPPTNAIDGKKTGIIYTSDWIDKNSYPDVINPLDNRYEEFIVNLDKLVRKGEWSYDIDLVFRDPIEPDYGYNILNVNDFFTIKKVVNGISPYYNNDVRGYIKEISIISETIVGLVKTIRYRLTCVVTEGDPYLNEIGDKYVWSRDEFRSDTNPLKDPPINLESLNVNTTDALLTWLDESQLGTQFIIRIRKDGSNLPGDIYYSDTITTINNPVYLLTYTVWGITSGLWRWSVCTIFDNHIKNFTMWSEESLLIIR